MSMKEFEIRPKEIFDEYIRISRNDIEHFFSDRDSFVEIDCPGCRGSKSEFSFLKYGFSYRLCNNCQSLFVSPRPREETINSFYRGSASSRFWAESFFPKTAEARREKIFRPRALLIKDLLLTYQIPSPRLLADVGAGFGIFLEEVEKLGVFEDIIGIEPSVDLAKCCKEKGFRVIEKPVEEVASSDLQASLACSFEVIEHLFDPEKFLQGMYRILKPGGVLLFTTLTISGLDLQVLWEHSKSISPPHHINFMSTEGLERLTKRCGFENVEIATPGKLDVDIIRNAMDEMPELSVPRFVDYLIRHRGQKTSDRLQQFLQDNNLSSHARVIAYKGNQD